MKSSDKKNRKTTQLLNKEEEFKNRNAALEERTASLINEVESVFRGQEDLFSNLDHTEGDVREVTIIPDKTDIIKENRISSKPPAILTNKKRPVSGPAGTSKKNNFKKLVRPCSSKDSLKNTTSPINLVEERAVFADRINTLEWEAKDDLYTPTNLNEEVLPEAASDLGADATVRFLKAKLRVMQEELENIATECRKKSSEITELNTMLKEKDSEQTTLLKKNEQLEKLIGKHKKMQNDFQLKNNDLESELSTIKKELGTMKRNNKETSANKNTLEVRLNRALEEVEKYKMALKNSKESSKALNETDRKKFEQLQIDNKRLETQKAELMAAFKKQLKLIDILKRQKMHIEAAKMLEFTEEEFIRALEWGST